VVPIDEARRPCRAPRLRILLAATMCYLSVAVGAEPGERRGAPEPGAAELYFPADPSLGLGAVSSPGLGPRFVPAGSRPLWVGREAPVAWLRFAIEPRPEGVDGARIVEVRPSFSIIMENVDLYVPLRGGGYRSFSGGAAVPLRAGELRGRSFMFPLPGDALEGGLCYLRVQGDTDVEYRVLVRDEADVLRTSILEGVLYGVVFGVLLAMALYNFFLFLSLGDTAYFFYVFYILAGAAWLFWVHGWARAILGSRPGLDQSLLWAFAGTMQAFGALFASSFLKLRGNRPALFALFASLSGLAAASAIAGALGFHRLAFVATNCLGGALCVLLILSTIARMVQGFALSRYFLVGWSALAVSGLLFVLMDLKVLPVTFVTANSVALGMTAESVLLSLALADRVRCLERENLKLERNQERLTECSIRDSLTGLYNRRFLSERIGTMVAEAEGGKLSVILLDIDGFKSINDTWGHPFGDEVLAALGRIIRSSLRDGDRPCRYGGEEFVILMPDIALDDATCVAERIRERFSSEALAAASGEEVRASVSSGVAELRPGEGPRSLLDRADKAMYEAKRLGKNRVVTAAPD